MNAIIAVNPQQMQEAQATTKAWIDVKLQAAEAAVDEADTVLDLLIKRRMNTSDKPARARAASTCLAGSTPAIALVFVSDMMLIRTSASSRA